MLHNASYLYCLNFLSPVNAAAGFPCIWKIGVALACNNMGHLEEGGRRGAYLLTYLCLYKALFFGSSMEWNCLGIFALIYCLFDLPLSLFPKNKQIPKSRNWGLDSTSQKKSGRIRKKLKQFFLKKSSKYV